MLYYIKPPIFVGNSINLKINILKLKTMANKFTRLERGKIGLIQETEDGRIIQIGLTPEQSELLQIFLSTISQGKPLVQMGKEYEMILKSDCIEQMCEYYKPKK